MEKQRTSTLAILGTKWVALGGLSQKLWQGVVMIVLARLLTPEDFGLVAVAMIALNMIQGIKSFGLNNALIQKQTDVTEAAHAFFFLNLLFSILLYGVLFGISPVVGVFFKKQEACSFMRVLSLQVLIEALAAPQRVLAMKELDLKKQTMILLGSSIFAGGISITLASKGWGAWALVYGPLGGSLFAAVLWWYPFRWYPSLHFRWPVVKDLLSFGMVVSGTGALTKAIDISNKIFVGKYLGISSLGFYEFTNRIIQWPAQNLSIFNQLITFPAFCEAQNDIDILKSWLSRIFRYSFLLMMPMTVGVFILSDHFVPILFGAKWNPTIPLIKILSLLLIGTVLETHTFPVYVSTNHVDIPLKVTAIRLLMTVPVLWVASQVSLIMVCVGQLILMCLFSPINLLLSLRIIGYTPRQFIQATRTPLEGTIIFTAVLLLFKYLGLRLLGQPNIFSLAITILPATGAYLLTVYRSQPEVFSEFKRIAKAAFGNQG